MKWLNRWKNKMQFKKWKKNNAEKETRRGDGLNQKKHEKRF